MIEVCGIDFIYMLYFKEPVINFGRVCKDDFLALLVSIFMCFTVMPTFSKRNQIWTSVILAYGVTYKPTMF